MNTCRVGQRVGLFSERRVAAWVASGRGTTFTKGIQRVGLPASLPAWVGRVDPTLKGLPAPPTRTPKKTSATKAGGRRVAPPIGRARLARNRADARARPERCSRNISPSFAEPAFPSVLLAEGGRVRRPWVPR
jgi:hypothetical protein